MKKLVSHVVLISLILILKIFSIAKLQLQPYYLSQPIFEQQMLQDF